MMWDLQTGKGGKWVCVVSNDCLVTDCCSVAREDGLRKTKTGGGGERKRVWCGRVDGEADDKYDRGAAAMQKEKVEVSPISMGPVGRSHPFSLQSHQPHHDRVWCWSMEEGERVRALDCTLTLRSGSLRGEERERRGGWGEVRWCGVRWGVWPSTRQPASISSPQTTSPSFPPPPKNASQRQRPHHLKLLKLHNKTQRSAPAPSRTSSHTLPASDCIGSYV
jgi:hypothetical protein